MHRGPFFVLHRAEGSEIVDMLTGDEDSRLGQRSEEVNLSRSGAVWCPAFRVGRKGGRSSTLFRG